LQSVRLETLTPLGWVGTAVTIGNFDGVHLGHQALIERVVSEARPPGGSVVLTFDPHPSRVLAPERAPGALTTTRQKEEIVASMRVDHLAVLPFTAEVAAWPPERFAGTVLARVLAARVVVVGEAFRFGHRQRGDVAVLRELGSGLGFSVVAIPPVLRGGSVVSSSRVREALAGGEVAEARARLGRPYFVDGEVVRGDGRGRAIGVPTANLRSENEVLPGRGVYAARLQIADEGPRDAVVNLGVRPTFGGTQPVLEAHVLDFEGDLYGARARLHFHARLREERRFPGRDELVAQIHEDVRAARAFLSGRRDEKV
jgi:riboflavin kinase/FMN adenylyltransferase